MRIALTLGMAMLIFGCAELVPEPYETSSGHIKQEGAEAAGQEGIPPLVEQAAPELPEPAVAEPQEKYTVVVNEVPVKEILFALARDAKVNVDVDPRIDGVVTLNAVDQTLTQLLDRIARQVGIRYEMQNDNLFIMPDEPFFRTYRVNFLGMTREMDAQIKLQTAVGGGDTGGGGGAGGGAGSSTGATNISVESKNRFWDTLVSSVQALISDAAGGGEPGGAGNSSSLVAYPETGLITVRATAAQHTQIQQLVDSAVESAQRQVMIQATIAEVTLSTKFQAGIDWSVLVDVGDATFNLASALLPGVGILGEFSSLVLDYTEDPAKQSSNVIDAQVRLLEEFGDVRILSTPQIMTLNNQTATLKVADDIVYYELDSDVSQSQTNTVTSVDSQAKTVSVGVTMSVTPQINSNDSIILNIRPAISRVLRFVPDPGVAILQAQLQQGGSPPVQIPNPGVPELRAREMESVLRLNSGQIAVLGGLMENNDQADDAGTPGVSRIQGLGELFKSRTRQSRKTELVIFLRPLVVRNPSLEADLKPYQKFLQEQRGVVSPPVTR
ncbi:MAG: secretin N-terminal domain-containing protein [Gammaproteobacteria bacterium]|nr:secretin N-terminal domain-containing protein [Gammaproteobacteria bacterium]